MKNKEIEELLSDIKKQITIDEKIGKEIAKDFHKTTLNYKEIKLLLSYIEQLENNRDKVIEEIKYLIGNCDIVDYQGEKIMNILKGDSDEFRNN